MSEKTKKTKAIAEVFTLRLTEPELINWLKGQPNKSKAGQEAMLRGRIGFWQAQAKFHEKMRIFCIEQDRIEKEKEEEFKKGNEKFLDGLFGQYVLFDRRQLKDHFNLRWLKDNGASDPDKILEQLKKRFDAGERVKPAKGAKQ